MSKTEKTPKKKRTGQLGMVRGGSWGNLPRHARVAYYFLDTPVNRSWNLGVRLVEVIDEQD